MTPSTRRHKALYRLQVFDLLSVEHRVNKCRETSIFELAKSDASGNADAKPVYTTTNRQWEKQSLEATLI